MTLKGFKFTKKSSELFLSKSKADSFSEWQEVCSFERVNQQLGGGVRHKGSHPTFILARMAWCVLNGWMCVRGMNERREVSAHAVPWNTRGRNEVHPSIAAHAESQRGKERRACTCARHKEGHCPSHLPKNYIRDFLFLRRAAAG